MLDIGCGFGDATLQIAALVGPEGEVLGLDVAPRFVAASSEEAARAGATNVRFAVADVQTAALEGGFDMAFARFGTMFFANPVAAMRNIRHSLVPGGRLVMTVWRQKVENEWMYRAQQVVERFVTQAGGVRRADVRARAVLDGRSRYDERHPACGRVHRRGVPPRRPPGDDRTRPGRGGQR